MRNNIGILSFRLLCLFHLALAAVACVQLPDIPKNQGEPGPEPGPATQSLRFVSFVFPSELNPRLDQDLVCTVGDASLSLTGRYPEEEGAAGELIASFEVEGTGQVTVTVDQQPQQSGLSANDFSEPVYYTLRDERSVRTYAVRLIPSTGLPVLTIETRNGRMPTSRDIWEEATLSLDGAGRFDRVPAEPIEIKRRGNSTFGFPKKAFNIRFAEKRSFLGMKKHKRWVLLANYRDKTLLRNDVTFHIGQHLAGLEWTPHSKFAELIFNGEHLGTFQITEQIRVDKNRVRIDEMTSTDVDDETLTGGYLLELDNYYGEVNKFRTRRDNLPVNIKQPGGDVMVPVQFSYIEDFVNTVENLLADGDFERVFADYLDIDSFVDYWMVYEIVGNTELHGPFSCYMYKKRGGKLYAGPIWDFDYTTFRTSYTSRISIVEYVWYKYLFQSDTFRTRVRERFAEALPFLRTVPDYIRSRQEMLRRSAELNWAIWTDIADTAKGNGDEVLPSDEAIDRMIEGYEARLATVEAYVAGL